jgi:hypothetical protein
VIVDGVPSFVDDSLTIGGSLGYELLGLQPSLVDIRPPVAPHTVVLGRCVEGVSFHSYGTKWSI